VWNRQRTDFDLVDSANTGLGHKPVQRWNLPEGWVISRHPAHPALVSEADFIAAQDATAPRGPARPGLKRAANLCSSEVQQPGRLDAVWRPNARS
jgi:site-specific DNA recombinase